MDIHSIIRIGLDVLSTTISNQTKRILATVGNVFAGTMDFDEVEWLQHVGFASRPSKPEPGKQAAQAVVITTSDTDVAIASVDQRGLDLYGQLDHGETCVYAPGETGTGQARILLKKDGGIHLYTRKGNTSSGTGMVVQLDAGAGAIRLINDKGYGIIIDDEGVKITSKEAGLSLKSNGDVSLIGKGATNVDGSSILLGSVAVPGVNSVLTGVTGLVGVASTKVFASTT